MMYQICSDGGTSSAEPVALSEGQDCGCATHNTDVSYGAPAGRLYQIPWCHGLPSVKHAV